jgi:hypothetical protein
MRPNTTPYDHAKPLQGQRVAPVLKTLPPGIENVMRPRDWAAFAFTAWWFQVYIMVRRSNPKSIRFVGEAGFTPKSAETKAKTAQNDFTNPVTGLHLEVGGLVCNPYAPGMEGAYAPHKLAGAKKEWDKFAATGRLGEAEWEPDGRVSTRPIRPVSARFFVDMNPKSKRFGALMRCDPHQPRAARYVHGDYDLFAIVPADDPATNIVVAEQHPASPWHPLARPAGAPMPESDPDLKSEAQRREEILNFRGRKFTDVQTMLNRRMGVTMILHGSQEKAVDSFREEVDVFFPDGETAILLEGKALENFYEGQLKGRKLFDFMTHGKTTGEPIPGALWRVLR